MASNSLRDYYLSLMYPLYIKFSFSEKATKFAQLSSWLVIVKTMRTIAQTFVAFSEKLRFKETEENFFVVIDRRKPRTSYLLDSKVQLF